MPPRRLFVLLVLTLLAAAKLEPRSAPAGPVPICVLQGAAFSSPYLGQTIETSGVVHLDLDDAPARGFFLQTESCDGNPATSDGIFVYLGERVDMVKVGDFVRVLGTVNEYYGQTEVISTPADVSVLEHDRPLPAPVSMAPPADPGHTWAYFESLESMRVVLDDGRVVGPAGSDGRTWLVRTDSGLERVMVADLPAQAQLICIGDGGLFEIDPPAAAGWQVLGLRGALSYAYGQYCLSLSDEPVVIPSLPPAVEFTSPAGTLFRLATFNLANLFDSFDDPDTEDSVISATEYQRRLQKRALAIHALSEPDLLAVQEAESLAVLNDLRLRPEIAAPYQAVLQDGPDQRGIDVGLLYRTDRMSIESYVSRQGCTSLVDGLGPDGNRNVLNPANTLTCDTNSDGLLDGNRLFSRPPLVARLQVCTSDCELPGRLPVTLVVVHLKSKTEDTADQAYTLPRRVEQAAFLNSLTREMRISEPGREFLLAGDLNDLPDSEPVTALADEWSGSAWSRMTPNGRYTYIFRGVSQPLDYIFAARGGSLGFSGAWVGHFNADFPVVMSSDPETFLRSSDHDPLLVFFSQLNEPLFLPLIRR